MRRSLAGLLAAAAALALAPACADAAFAGANGRIAFVRAGRGIWTVNPDGSGLARVSPAGVAGAGCDSEPSFSPSGLLLVFQTCDPSRHATAVGTMTDAGLDRRTVVRSSSKVPSPQTPIFAPDGERLAFAGGASPATHLYRIKLNGRKRHSLGAIGYAPSWSATAGLAYTAPLNQRRWCNSTEIDDVYRLDPSSGRRTRLTETYGSYGPDWAPDGRHVAFTRDYSVTSGDEKHVRNTPTDCRVTYSRMASYGPEVVVARKDGTRQKRLTHSGGQDPSWSPDGKRIAFERGGHVWTMRSNGKDAHRIVRGTQPAWQPLPG